MKAIGYIVAIIGAIGVLLKQDFFIKILGFPLPAITQTTTFLIGSVIVFIVGVAMITMGGGGSSKGGGEVPIYSGKRIVGYRRV